MKNYNSITLYKIEYIFSLTTNVLFYTNKIGRIKPFLFRQG